VTSLSIIRIPKRRPSKARKVVGLATAFVMTVAVLTGISLTPSLEAPPAEAASGADFNPGLIITDELFYNGTLMSESAIQSFLEGRVPACTAPAGAPGCLKNYVTSSSPRAADRYCAAYAGGTNQRASNVIAQVAQACNISPQVLLVTLQKERGLITKTNPISGDYLVSMGYACPDTAACDTKYYGFANQVYSAARQFNIYKQLPTSFSYRAGQANTIQWHPNAACGSSSVYIYNAATAGLYNYTPYRPNQAALNNIGGTGDDCSSYGNRNFFAYYSDWFGSPNQGNLQSPSFEGGSIYGWGASNGAINTMIAPGAPGTVPDGSYFLALNTPVSGRALSQDIKRTISPGQQATAKIWVRSDSTTPFTGTVAVWGIGGSLEQANTPFTVRDQWTEITVKLPVASAHSTIRLDIYLYSTNATLWVDNASITVGQAPTKQNLLKYPGFEGSFNDWAPGNGFMNRALYQDVRFVKEGTWFAASNTAVPGRSFSQTVPVQGYAGDQYTFSIWLRSSDPSKPFSGIVALWALGSQNANTTANYTVQGEYTKVTVTLDSPIAFSALKAEVYLNTTDATLFLDDSRVSKNLLSAPSFEGGALNNWGTGNGAVAPAVATATAASPAVHGSYYATVTSQTPNGSFAQVVERDTTAGEKYIATVWVKSPTGSTPGTFALWALGGTTEALTVPFTATGAWQQLTLELPIAQQSHNAVKVELYFQNAGTTLLIDGAQLL